MIYNHEPEILSFQVHNCRSRFMIHVCEIVSLFFQVYNDRSEFMIHVHELDLLNLSKYRIVFGVKILVHEKLPETGSRLMQNNRKVSFQV